MNSKNINKKRSRSGQKYRPVLFVLAFCAILGIIFYLSGGLGTYKNADVDTSEISRAVSMLSSMEENTLPNPDEFQKNLQDEPETEMAEVTQDDIYDIQYSILEHFGDYDYNSENFRRWFEDTAIVGDSVAEAISGFDWIYPQNLQAQVGISLESSQEVIDGTKWLQPSTIFLTFSANDIAHYGVGIDTYINVYSAVIKDLKDSLPWARIFVQGILPCQPEFSEEYWYYSYLDDYNSAIQQMCEELDVNYFDSGFILYAHPNIYAEDGLHPTWEFYPLWLTYMAQISGLSSR